MLAKRLKQVIRGEELSRAEMGEAIDAMLGGASPLQSAGFLAALETKGVTVGELVGAVEAMDRHAHRIRLEGPLCDIVGTGGDGAGLANISTPASIVAAACGMRVAKHGNRAISSQCGAADLVEEFGIPIDLPPDRVQRAFEGADIAFLYAPRHHPAFAQVGPVRRALGVRNLFHLLGPLLNPAGADRMVLGLYDPGLLNLYAEAVAQLPIERALIICGHGCDELTPLGPSRALRVEDGAIEEVILDPASVGVQPCRIDELKGGGAELNRDLIERALGGERGPLYDSIAMTAGAALMLEGMTFLQGVNEARGAIDRGEPLKVLERWKQCTLS